MTINICSVDLSNEVLNIDFGQGAAKISEVKVGSQKKYLPTWPGLNQSTRGRPSRPIFFRLPTLTLISLQPLDQGQFSVPHLKDLFHICLEIKAQGFQMTFKVFNHG